MAAKKKSSAKSGTSTVVTYDKPPEGAFIYIDHPEIKVVRVVEKADVIWKTLEDADPENYDDWIELTARRPIGADGAPPFVEEPLRIRIDRIVAFA